MAKYRLEIITLIVFVIILIGSILYFVNEYENYQTCQQNEHVSCPTYSCGREKETTNSVCYGDAYNTAFMPYRTTKDGNIECMDPQLAPVIYRKPSATLEGSSF